MWCVGIRVLGSPWEEEEPGTVGVGSWWPRSTRGWAGERQQWCEVGWITARLRRETLRKNRSILSKQQSCPGDPCSSPAPLLPTSLFLFDSNLVERKTQLETLKTHYVPRTLKTGLLGTAKEKWGHLGTMTEAAVSRMRLGFPVGPWRIVLVWNLRDGLQKPSGGQEAERGGNDGGKQKGTG